MSASIFNGSAVKILKNILRFKNGVEYITDQNIDPSVVGYAAPIGSKLVRNDTGLEYTKIGALDTDWKLIGSISGEVSVSNSGSATLQNSAVINKLINTADFHNVTATTDSIATGIAKMDEALSSNDRTGFYAWTSGSDASTYSIVTGTFNLLRSGYGFIKSKKITFIAQSIGSFLANTTNYIYIDSTGTIQKTTVKNESLYLNNIVLFSVLFDGTNYIVVKENHALQFPSTVSNYLESNVGQVLQGSGGIVSSATVGTGTLITDRQLKITSGVVDDHGLSTSFNAINPVTFDIYHTNSSGYWNRYSQASQLPMYYNNSGTPTILGTTNSNSRTVYSLYVAKDDINSSDPKFIAVMDTVIYSSLSNAIAAINAGANARATNELANIELSYLGFVVVRNNANGGFIEEVIVARSTLAQQIGGGSTSSHLLLQDLNAGTYGDGGHTNMIVSKITTTNPTVNDDINFYKQQSLWLNTSTKQQFINIDNTAGASVWRESMTQNRPSVFTTDYVTPIAYNSYQTWRYTGTSSGAAFTGFGTLSSNFRDGDLIILSGTSDTYFLKISNNDVANGWLTNGPLDLTKSTVIWFSYNETLGRMIEINRSR